MAESVGFQGADVAALDRVAATAADGAERLEAIRTGVGDVAERLRDTRWFTGPAAVATTDHLTSVVAPRLAAAVALLRAAARELGTQSGQQRDASAAGTTTAATSAAPTAAPILPAALLGATPQAVTEHFAGLDRAAAAALADRYPATVGRLDGAPGWVRDRANRHLLGPAEQRLHDERARLQAAIEDRRRSGPPDARLAGLRRELAEVESRLVVVRRIAGGDHLQLLRFDPDGDRIVVAVGDVDTASHLATIVPGTYADLGRMSGYLDVADQLAFSTRQRLGPDGGGVAAVTWLDYDAPPSLLAATSPSRAVDGAPALGAYTAGIAAVNPEARHTLLGHSYGAVVVGEAGSRFPLEVDAVVGIGAPGMRVSSVEELQLPEGTPVYAVTDRVAPADPIRHVDGGPFRFLTGRLGPDTRGIGAESFDVSDADRHDLFRYLDPERRAGYNVGSVVVGPQPTPPVGGTTQVETTADPRTDP